MTFAQFFTNIANAIRQYVTASSIPAEELHYKLLNISEVPQLSGSVTINSNPTSGAFARLDLSNVTTLTFSASVTSIPSTVGPVYIPTSSASVTRGGFHIVCLPSSTTVVINNPAMTYYVPSTSKINGGTYNYKFNFGDVSNLSSTYQNWFKNVTGDSKKPVTWNVTTDNSTIASYVAGLAGEYVTVNRYKLDGTSW